MTEVKKTANVDDYYAHISEPKSESGTEQKAVSKLKIKKKAVVDAVPEASVPTPAPIVETPKAPARKPAAISFEPAPVVTVRPAVSEPERKKVDRPIPGAKPPTSEPLGKRLSGNSFVSTPERQRRPSSAPRISFEPAPVFKPLESRPVAPLPTSAREHRPPRSTQAPQAGSVQTPRPGSDRLKTYANAHPTEQKKRFDGSRSDGPAGKKSPPKVRGYMEDDGGFRRSGKLSTAGKKERKVEDVKQILVDRTGQEVEIPDILSVKEFSDKIGVPLPKVIGELMKNGMLVNLNAKIDFDTCFLISEAFHVKVVRERNAEVSASSLLEGDLAELLKNDDQEKMTERAPVISIMGHVDHGKTSILDYIRHSHVAAGEAGGITQRIGAYQVERNGKKITFLDTPGHEAFSIMRSRGARLTDLAVIVIAADEGMKPQTIESINHAKEAEVPMIIAVNKMDKPGANLDLIRGQLAEQGLQPEDWGGDTVVVPVSAHTGLGIETLLDMIVLSTEMM